MKEKKRCVNAWTKFTATRAFTHSLATALITGPNHKKLIENRNLLRASYWRSASDLFLIFFYCQTNGQFLWFFIFLAMSDNEKYKRKRLKSVTVRKHSLDTKFLILFHFFMRCPACCAQSRSVRFSFSLFPFLWPAARSEAAELREEEREKPGRS